MHTANIIRNALRYSYNFRDKYFFIKVDHNALGEREDLQLIDDIRLLKQNIGIKIALFYPLSHMHSNDESMVLFNSSSKIDIEELVDPNGPTACYNEEESELLDWSAAQLAIKSNNVPGEKLIYITKFDGIFSENGSLIHLLTLSQAQELLVHGHINGPIKKKLEYSVNACQNGVNRAHIISSSYHRSGSLLKELFTPEGVGTMICTNIYEEFRLSTPEDYSGILEVFTQNSIYHSLRPVDIKIKIENIWVYTLDGEVCGCIILNHHSDDTIEIECLASLEIYKNNDMELKLIELLFDKFKDKNIHNFLINTDRNHNWVLLNPKFNNFGFLKQKGSNTLIAQI